MEITEGIMTFVGIDVHCDQCSIKAIFRQGDDLLAADVITSGKALFQVFSGLPGHDHIGMAEIVKVKTIYLGLSSNLVMPITHLIFVCRFPAFG